jgi:Icc-related predicted phosphoesterase
LNDFRTQGLTTAWYDAQNVISVEYIESQLKKLKKDQRRIVVTHHTPSFRSCHPRWEGDPMNHCFHSNLHQLMSEDWAPEIWIHGHTHDACEYVQGNTRVICNPKGYPNEHPRYREDEIPYNDDLIIEI